MDDPAPHQPPYGFLLILRLLRRAAYDKRVTGFQHRVLSIVASFSDTDYTCFVSTSTVAGLLGVSRQWVQKALIKLEDLGYFRSTRRWRPNGGETTKLFVFNDDLADVDACFWRPTLSQAATFHSVSEPGEHHPSVAGGASSDRGRPLHHLEDAQRNPKEETTTEETIRGTRFTNGAGSDRNEQVDCSAKKAGDIGMSKAAAWDQRQQNKALDRINRDLARDIDVMTLVLETLTGETFSKALEAALRSESRRPGNGAKYLIAVAKNVTDGKKGGARN
jgi:hypothetical protein